MSKGSSSWIDDYFDWLSIEQSCCRINKITNESCISNRKWYLIIIHSEKNEIKFFKIFSNFLLAKQSDPNCILCRREFHNVNGVKRPTPETFDKFLPVFLQDIPDTNCAKAGKPAYSSVRFYVISSLRIENKKNYLFIYLKKFTGCTHFIHKIGRVLYELSHKSYKII